MASGLPVIAYDTENTRGIIQDGKTGALVPE
jgi:glycosyltransferase involved in cell wall biosynthesis